MTNIGFVGLGIMGGPMASHLNNNGHNLLFLIDLKKNQKNGQFKIQKLKFVGPQKISQLILTSLFYALEMIRMLDTLLVKLRAG